MKEILKNNWGYGCFILTAPLTILGYWLKNQPEAMFCYTGQIILLAVFAFIFCGGLRFVK